MKVIENWVYERDNQVAKQQEEMTETVTWATRIVEAIERARIDTMFDPDRAEPKHAAEWFEICDSIDLFSWARPPHASRPRTWNTAARLAREQWESDRDARQRAAETND